MLHRVRETYNLSAVPWGTRERVRGNSHERFWRKGLYSLASRSHWASPLVEGRTPWDLSLILTHIFFGSLVEWNEMGEVVIYPAIRLDWIGHFTKSICKMWVRIRDLSRGVSE